MAPNRSYDISAISATTRDYDLVHCGVVPTRLISGFELGSAFSLNVWVRFLEPSSNGTFVQIIEVA